MPKDFNKTLQKINFFLKKMEKAQWIVGRRAFLVILVLMLAIISWAGFLSYKYVVLADKNALPSEHSLLRFDDQNYQKLLKYWQEREAGAQDHPQKKYSSPF